MIIGWRKERWHIPYPQSHPPPTILRHSTTHGDYDSSQKKLDLGGICIYINKHTKGGKETQEEHTVHTPLTKLPLRPDNSTRTHSVFLLQGAVSHSPLLSLFLQSTAFPRKQTVPTPSSFPPSFPSRSPHLLSRQWSPPVGAGWQEAGERTRPQTVIVL